MKNDNFKYELMVIASLENGLQNAVKQVESIKKKLTKIGELFFEDIWGERELAYPMKKQERGYYAVFNFSGGSDKLKSLNDYLRLDKEIIRHLLIKVPFKYQAKTLSELIKAKEAEESIKKE